MIARRYRSLAGSVTGSRREVSKRPANHKLRFIWDEYAQALQHQVVWMPDPSLFGELAHRAYMLFRTSRL